MIRPETVEKALFRWPEYLDALFAFRRDEGYAEPIEDVGGLPVSEVEAVALASSAEEKVNRMGLGRMDVIFVNYRLLYRRGEEHYGIGVLRMPVYFLCCAFCLDQCWDKTSGLDLRKIIYPVWLGGEGEKVYPPAIFNLRDFPYEASIPPDHELWTLAKIRRPLRYRDFSASIDEECLKLRLIGLYEDEIGQRFNWNLQWDAYGRYRVCRTARHATARAWDRRALTNFDESTDL